MGPESLMLPGHKSPFAGKAATPGQCARGRKGCLQEHGPGRSQTQPGERLPTAALLGLRHTLYTHTHIYISIRICMQTSMLRLNFLAPICCVQREMSPCAGARTAVCSAEIPLALHFGTPAEAQLVLTPRAEASSTHTRESEASLLPSSFFPPDPSFLSSSADIYTHIMLPFADSTLRFRGFSTSYPHFSLQLLILCVKRLMTWSL